MKPLGLVALMTVAQGALSAHADTTLAAGPVMAQGPAAVATIDRRLWPHGLDSRDAFDRASRAEILVFTQALSLAAREKSAASGGGRRWLEKMRVLLVDNFRRARESCRSASELGCDGGLGKTFELLAQYAQRFVDHAPAELAAWLPAAREFHRLYAAEQLRLASLFPRTSSEILTFDPAERNGTEMPDLHFLLTFDDGPTPEGGETDRTVRALQETGKNGVFFALGKSLEARRKQGGAAPLRVLYAGQCLGSHGFAHGSLAKSPDWKGSIEATRELVRAVAGLSPTENVLFRPPYGQRTKELALWAASAGSPVVLWNIDSQDWNPKIAAAAVPDRLLTLMALWRHGILLFHDIHAKAAHALPVIVKTGDAAGLTFVDCRSFGG
jgi:peptidoglycan/xylan/chitin deacetylase (PgdA/CDA1 family)